MARIALAGAWWVVFLRVCWGSMSVDPTCDRRWTISYTDAVSADGFVSHFDDCNDAPRFCGSLRLPSQGAGGAVSMQMTLESTTVQPGIGGAHEYLFNALLVNSTTADLKFVDGDFGCGYDLYRMTDGQWQHLALLEFTQGTLAAPLTQKDREQPPINNDVASCTPGTGPRPWYMCQRDADCVACPSGEFYFAYCENITVSPRGGACHFNNDGRGTALDHQPKDDKQLFRISQSGTRCLQLTVYHDNSHFVCFERFWAKTVKAQTFANYSVGTCPSAFSKVLKQQMICEGQGAPTSTLTTHATPAVLPL